VTVFDVGPRGITGHFDTMLGKLRQATPSALFAFAAWAWVWSWPPQTAFFRIGPVLTFGTVVKLALLAFTVWACAPLLMAVWYWANWRALEREGLRLQTRNDFPLRVIHSDPERGVLFDQTTQTQRIYQARTATHNRQAAIWQGVRSVIVGFIWFLAVPIGIALLPKLTGHHLYFLTRPPDFPRMAAHALAAGELDTAHWYGRGDVREVLGQLSIEGVVAWLVFFLVVVPRASNLFWRLYDGVVVWRGNQYVPGAKVLERLVAEKTLDTLREQQIHGPTEKAPLGEAARRMAE
jgi:hypothetical protein